MPPIRMRVDGTLLEVDLEDLEWGEIIDIEEMAGMGLARIGDAIVEGRVRPVGAVVFAAMRKQNPELTQEAFRGLKFSKVEFLSDEEENPTGAAADAPESVPPVVDLPRQEPKPPDDGSGSRGSSASPTSGRGRSTG